MMRLRAKRYTLGTLATKHQKKVHAPTPCSVQLLIKGSDERKHVTIAADRCTTHSPNTNIKQPAMKAPLPPIAARRACPPPPEYAGPPRLWRKGAAWGGSVGRSAWGPRALGGWVSQGSGHSQYACRIRRRISLVKTSWRELKMRRMGPQTNSSQQRRLGTVVLDYGRIALITNTKANGRNPRDPQCDGVLRVSTTSCVSDLTS
jgi:hypothetical protein